MDDKNPSDYPIYKFDCNCQIKSPDVLHYYFEAPGPGNGFKRVLITQRPLCPVHPNTSRVTHKIYLCEKHGIETEKETKGGGNFKLCWKCIEEKKDKYRLSTTKGRPKLPVPPQSQEKINHEPAYQPFPSALADQPGYIFCPTVGVYQHERHCIEYVQPAIWERGSIPRIHGGRIECQNCEIGKSLAGAFQGEIKKKEKPRTITVEKAKRLVKAKRIDSWFSQQTGRVW